jgi:hypothetical protein
MPSYGLLGPTDPTVIERTLLEVARVFKCDPPFRVLEIGVCEGKTARGIKEFLDSYNIKFEYWGVDNQRDRSVELPFPGANLVIGDSTTEYHRIPNDKWFRWILIDGCHCVNHAMLDFLHYSPLLSSGGFILFHDTNPDTQGKLDYQGHGPKDNPDMYISTRKAMELLGLSTGYLRGWSLVEDAIGKFNPNGVTGGITVFRKD